MGAGNVKRVFGDWSRLLKDRETLVLVHMALTSKDGETPPRYYKGWQAIAEAIGLDPDSKTAPELVRRSIQALVDAGALVPSGRAYAGVRAEYALALDLNATWQPTLGDGREVGWSRVDRSGAPTDRRGNKDRKAPTNRGGSANPKPPQTVGARAPTDRREEPPQIVGKSPHELWGPRSNEEQLEENGEESSSPQVGTSLVPARANDGSGLVEADPANSSEALVTHFVRELDHVGVTAQPKGTWRAAAAALLQRDTPESIGKVIHFALTDTFWAGKVLTLPKLVDHYAQLRLRSRASEYDGLATGTKRALATQELIRQLEAEEAAGDVLEEEPEPW